MVHWTNRGYGETVKSITRIKRAAAMPVRVQQTANQAHQKCMFLGCHNYTRAAASNGLNERFCRKHEDHYQRHGSYYKSSYTAAQLEPYRKAAMKWIKKNHSTPQISIAIQKIEGLYLTAGRKIEATNLNGMKPVDRARVVWARLREAQVDPKKPLAAYLAVEHLCKVDPERSNQEEFKLVQEAKLVHRMASGTHKRWEQGYWSGKMNTVELHKYPQSRGRVLRHLGKQLSDSCYLAADMYLDEMGGSLLETKAKGSNRRKAPETRTIQTDTTGATKIENIKGTMVIRW